MIVMSATRKAAAHQQVLLLCLLSLLCPFGAMATVSNNATLRLLHDASAAKCLDGSPPGYYYRPPKSGATSKLLVHFLGGGWCWTATDCASRATTDIGSSSNWPPLLDQTSFYAGGIMNATRADNRFADWALAYVMYCDGSSYTGNRTTPLAVGNQTLHFRGRAILDALVNDWRTTQGLANATDVVVSGSSAGGLTVYLHLDAIAAAFGPKTRVVGMVDAGYFLDALTTTGDPLYGNEARGALPLWGTGRSSFDASCATSHSDADLWKCFFAMYSISNIATPIFITNSMIDAWQLPNVLGVHCKPGLGDPGQCSQADIAAIQQWGEVTMPDALAPALKRASPNKLGYFLDRCFIHTETCGDSWYDYKAGPHGNISMAIAFSSWYFNGMNVTITDSSAWPWQAGYNPSCSASSGGWC